MSENLATWDKLSRPPATALKRIAGGRLVGMTDINPQWRLQMMTEHFGPIGVGWYYEQLDRWTEPGASEEAMCFVSINLYVKVDGDWSKPIYGIGGSKVVAFEKGKPHSNDEGYKMATTDALSVAMKEIGVGAAIYQGLWDGSKYVDLVEGDEAEAVANWLKRCEEASNSDAEKFAPWWKKVGDQVKEDCGIEGAAQVHDAYKTYLSRLKAEANDKA